MSMASRYNALIVPHRFGRQDGHAGGPFLRDKIALEEGVKEDISAGRKTKIPMYSAK